LGHNNLTDRINTNWVRVDLVRVGIGYELTGNQNNKFNPSFDFTKLDHTGHLTIQLAWSEHK